MARDDHSRPTNAPVCPPTSAIPAVHRFTFTVVVALLAFGLLPPTSPEDSGAQIDTTPTIHGATQAEYELGMWAAGRFASAGLSLPHLDVHFYDDRERCKGFLGLHRSLKDSVLICNRGGYSTAPTSTVLHEFAHAWADENLGAGDREAFLAHRGLESWDSRDLAWWKRGQEQTAEIVAWGLMDEPFGSAWLHVEQCVDLANAFRLLTGRDPLHESTDYC